MTCAPTATRTRDLLLRRHFRSVAVGCWMSPDVLFGCSRNGRIWPGVAPCLRSLAPRLAPRDLVSDANVRMLGGPEPSRDPRSRFKTRIEAGGRRTDSANPQGTA